MPLSTATVTFDLSDHFGNDYDTRRGIRAWVDTNIPDDTIVDTDGNQVRIGSGKVTVADNGTGSFTVWVPGVGSNPASWQTYLHVEYVPNGFASNRGGNQPRTTRTFGPFTITGNADLADLIEEQEVPPEYAGVVVAQMEALRDETATDRAFVEARVVDDLGTTDGQTKALIETPSSLTATALSATIAAQAVRHRVTDNGATGNDTTNDGPAIKALIDARIAAVQAGGLEAGNEVRIEAGTYNIGTTQLTLPPYLKLVLTGTVVLRYSGTGTALHVTPLATDSLNIYSPFQKQQWCNAPIIQGGGLVLVGTSEQGIGMEVGPRSNALGPYRPMSRYLIGNVAVESFAVGLQMNTYHHYLGAYDNLHLEKNATQMRVGAAGVGVFDSGENFEFRHCLFASGAEGIRMHADAWDATFTACSFDYLERLATIEQGYGHLNLVGGHIEGINDPQDADDGMFVSTVTDGEAMVRFDGVTVLSKVGVPWFRGPRLTVVGDLVQRPMTNGPTALDSILAESTVRSARLTNQRLNERRIVSREHNRLPDPTFAAETNGVKAGDLAGWSVEQSGVAVEIVGTGSPIAGGKLLRLTIAPAGYIILRSLVKVPLRHDLERHATMALKTSATGAHAEGGAVFQATGGADLAAEPTVSMDAEPIAAGVWRFPASLTNLAANANLGQRESVKPWYVVTNPTGSSITVDVAYLYFGA